MSAKHAKAVCEWLESFGHRAARPVKVTIARKKKTQVYFGARYLWVDHYSPADRAVSDARKKEGDEYTRDVFYLVGDLPASYHVKMRGPGGYSEQAVVYTVPGDDGDWYVSGYFEKTDANSEFHELHPFGTYFSLSRWDHESLNERIDRYGMTRERLPITVEELP